MRRSLTVRLYASFLVYLGLVVGLSVACSWLLAQQRSDGLVVNLSGRQRMLTQRVTHQLLRFAALEGSERSTDALRAAALSSMQVFETTLNALDRGGPAPLDLQMANLGTVPRASAAVHQQILRVQEVWGPFRAHARIILDGTASQRAQAVDHIVTHNTELLSEMNSVVSLMQREAESKVETLVLIQYGAIGAGVLVTLLLFLFVHGAIAAPLRQLAEASREMSLGNLHKEVPVAGPREIANIGQSFERLRLSLRTIKAAHAPRKHLDPIDRELMSL